MRVAKVPGTSARPGGRASYPPPCKDTHPAFTKLLSDLVVGDGGVDHARPILPLRGYLLRTTDVMNYDIFSGPGS